MKTAKGFARQPPWYSLPSAGNSASRSPRLEEGLSFCIDAIYTYFFYTKYISVLIYVIGKIPGMWMKHIIFVSGKLIQRIKSWNDYVDSKIWIPKLCIDTRNENNRPIAFINMDTKMISKTIENQTHQCVCRHIHMHVSICKWETCICVYVYNFKHTLTNLTKEKIYDHPGKLTSTTEL